MPMKKHKNFQQLKTIKEMSNTADNIMDKKRYDMVKETFDIILNNIESIAIHSTSEIAPMDPVAVKANEIESFPNWLPEEVGDHFDELWGFTNKMKSIVKKALMDLGKYERYIK